MQSRHAKLTIRNIKTLTPGSTDYFVWDTKIPGFGLRVWPSGRKSFIFQYRNMHRESRRPVIGQFGVMPVERARKIAGKWAAEVREGRDPSGEKQMAAAAIAVAELAQRYMDEHAKVKKRPRSAEEDARNLRIHVLPALGKRKVEAITRGDITKLHHAMRDTPGAANRVLALQSKMFNLAEKWGLRPDGSNPCRHVEKYPERKLERFLSTEELGQLSAVLTQAERERVEMPSVIAAIRLLLFTGCRLSEILTLQWSYVDFENACLRLPETKTGARIVHLSPPALEVLSKIERDPESPWVIVGAKPSTHLVNLRKPWYRLRNAAGLDDVRIHDLRHSFASVAVASGLSLPMIGALLGHTQTQTTQRYAHLAADPLRQAAGIVGGKIAAAMTRPSEGAAKERELSPNSTKH